MRIRRRSVYRYGQRLEQRWRPLYALGIMFIALMGAFSWSFAEPYVNAVLPSADARWRTSHSTTGSYPPKPATTDSTTTTTAPATTAPTATQPTAIRNQKYGIAFGGELGYVSVADMNTYLDDAAALGVGWIRFDMSWGEVQGQSSSTYDWSVMDRVISAGNARNIRMLPILAYTPQWARPAGCSNDDKCAPADNAAFAKFAAEAAKRYASQNIHTWEIWNEPNTKHFWLPSPSASGYTALLKAAATSINAVDPAATIVTGGLASTANENGNIDQLTYLDGMYKAGGASSFDAVGYHPYSYPALPTQVEIWNAWSKMAAIQQSIRNIMIANGDTNKPLWPTEFGAPTNGPGIIATVSNQNFESAPDHVDEDLQANMIDAAAKDLAGKIWSGPLFWYSYKDLGTDKADTENFYGLLRKDGTKKAAYTHFQTIVKQ